MNELDRIAYVADLKRKCIEDEAKARRAELAYAHSQLLFSIASMQMAEVMAAPWRALAAEIRASATVEPSLKSPDVPPAI